jgi:type I restriction enzyme M protein
MKLNEIYETEEILIENKKTGKEESKTIYKPKVKNGKTYIPLKDEWRDLSNQPEEKVRQVFICKLINDYGYCLDQMKQEVKLTTSQRGRGGAYADIVIWKTKKDKEENKTAFMVIELKAEALNLKPEDFYQGYNYATWSRAKLFVISNGRVIKIYKTIEEELPLSLNPVSEIPQAKDIKDEKKLEDILSKTKEFTGDEFAKLLHKCHNIIRNNDKLDPANSFDEISKVLFLKIMYERNPDDDYLIFSKQKVKKEIEIHSKKIARGETTLSYLDEKFNGVKNAFKNDGIFEENERINIREKSFIEIVQELEIYNLTATSEDVKGIAFETFLGRTFRGELGQFFTPRVIVNFIVELLAPQEKELICDPCAGSGGFLIKSFESVKKSIDDEYIVIKQKKYKEIFGDFKKLSDDDEKKLSKEEFKIYDNKKQEYIKKRDDEKLLKEYNEYLIKTNKEQDKKIKYLSKKSIFGTDANPRMARVSKMNMIMHGDGHNGIHHNDGLLNVNGIFKGRFDCIFTNPPFGTTYSKTLPTVEKDDKYTNEDMIEYYSGIYPNYEEEMRQVTDNFGKPIRNLFEVGKTSGATEVLFIERCLTLLRAGGRMGIVLPEGVLNSSNLQSAREYFESQAKILLVVSLPQDIFISSGATVKTSLVFFKKFTDKEKNEYETLKEESETTVKDKYKDELETIQQPLLDLNARLKEITSEIKKLDKKQTEDIKKLKDEEKELKANKKIVTKEQKSKLIIINQKIEGEIKELVREKFDYEIPIVDIKQAGITTTGKETHNELIELLDIYTKYRKENNLWEVKK